MKNDKDIWNELQAISPLLFKMRQEVENPFKVPEGYFESLKNEVFRAIDTGLADEIGKKAFKVPDNYFEQLTSDIMSRVDAEEAESAAPGGKLIDLNMHRKRQVFPVRRMAVMAASVAIFLLLGVFTARFFLQSDVSEPAFAITEEEAFDYIENNWTEFESEDLLALVDFSDENAAPAMTHGTQDGPQEFEDELEQYLEDHIDDLDIDLLTSEI